ncbi:uncharacterized protein B0P05DRAFT_600701 [Gilbertella persicaria]|uniref:uncharacterized protein n=1 Tax=Gilbertella persicaria TaxID=101096 RepID=UPI00221E4684|nr:uncharacterized protein B0P05DRAFT_600701 [Gilbertella persicaria]KAI8049109.1 hypothetical protein B0P05DRAFT_600701 [Gilbertella persicaria]
MPEQMFPIWAIVLIALLASVFITTLFLYIKMRKRSKTSVHFDDEEMNNEKETLSRVESLQTLVTQKHKSSLTIQKPSMDFSAVLPPMPPLTKTLTQYNNDSIIDNESLAKELDTSLLAPSQSNLNFSDKIELNELYDSTRQQEEFISIDLDAPISPVPKSHSPKVFDKVFEHQVSLSKAQNVSSSSAKTIADKPEIKEKTDQLAQDSPVPLKSLEPVSKVVIRSTSSRKNRSFITLNDNEKRKSKFGSVRFNSVRAPKSSEHLTITSGSMRRLVRESILVEDDHALPLPSAATIASNTNASRKPMTNTSVLEIAGWWDTPKSSSTSFQVEKQPLKTIISGGDSTSSSSTPPQYRASLSTSVFSHGTLSKSSMLEAASAMSRHSSFKKTSAGTLGRNTLRNIAAQNVNRSLKSLFDAASNTVVPDDSLKMEIDDDSYVDSSNDSIVSSTQQAHSRIQRKDTYSSKRSYLHQETQLVSSESSTKYALSDEESEVMSNELLNDHLQHIDATVQEAASDTVISTGKVNVVRRMLQETWNNNIKDSGSTYSMLSEIELSSPLPLNTKLPSRLAQYSSQHPQVPLEDSVAISGPKPSASFSSSTVRTVIPAVDTSDLANTRQNAITIKHGSNKIQQDHDSFRFSSTSSAVMNDSNILFSSPRHSSIGSSTRNHSRKSSGGNSAATALRLSNGHTNKTWNGRANKATRPSVVQQFGNNQVDERAFFSTMRKGQKTRAHIPWSTLEQEKTPAQIERDKYLQARQ